MDSESIVCIEHFNVDEAESNIVDIRLLVHLPAFLQYRIACQDVYHYLL